MHRADTATISWSSPGINYRAEIWLNGQLVADSSQIVGMYTAHELDVTRWIRAGPNVLAVKVIPERALQDVDGVELADSWWDWINWRYLGYQGPGQNPVAGNSFIPDRNAGIFKPVYLRTAGAAEIGYATVNTELPLPRTDSARLTVYANVHNSSDRRINGVVRATISRPGKPQIEVEQPVTLSPPGERREVTFSPARFTQLTVEHPPDLWWPYTMGDPSLYDLKLEFRQYNRVIDTSTQRFGIRTIVQHRDTDEQFPELGSGGSFYLTVNGRDFLVRGAVYTPDLLFDNDPRPRGRHPRLRQGSGPQSAAAGSEDPGGERLIERADELGIPLMVGWMCCNQWEKWAQWNDEDRSVALASLRSQILMLRSHPSVAIWANGSDGLPPERCAASTTRYCGICTGRTRWWTRSRRSGTTTSRVGRSGTASTWPARTPGGRRATGSAAGTAPPAVPMPNRATTSTSRRWRASSSSFHPTSCGRSTTRGPFTPAPTRATRN